MRYLLLMLMILALFSACTAAATPADEYARQVAEYNRRVAEQRWTNFILLGVGAACILYVVVRQATVRRRYLADVQKSHERGQRMIELLESIDRKLDRP